MPKSGSRASTSISAASASANGRKAIGWWPWSLVLVAFTYVALVTADLKLGPLPLKAVITLAAIVAWAVYRYRHPSSRPPLTAAVLLLGLGVPAVWLAIAVVRDQLSDPAQSQGLRAAAEEASRFFYVLLYFPLTDWYRTEGNQAHQIWLGPIYALCALTWALFVGNQVFQIDYGTSGRFGPLRGDFGVSTTGGFRAFMVTQVSLIAASALLLSEIRVKGLDASRLAAFSFVTGAAIVSHARGIWLGIVVAAATVLLVGVWRDGKLRRGILPAMGMVYIVGLTIVTCPTVARPVVEAITGGASEASTGTRLAQAPHLIDGFERHPMIGSGLGATLPNGYRRSESTPWSYELAWLQLLFQTGIVGLACILLAPALAGRRALAALARAGPQESIAPTAGIAVLAGLTLTYAGNPYLLTSIGTATLAIALSLCACGVGAARLDVRRPL